MGEAGGERGGGGDAESVFGEEGEDGVLKISWWFWIGGRSLRGRFGGLGWDRLFAFPSSCVMGYWEGSCGFVAKAALALWD